MRSLPYSLLAAAAAFWATSRAFAGDMHAECPTRIPEESIKPDQPIPGWITTPSQMHLQGAGMMAGAPETATYLVPDKNTKEKQTFEFDKGDGQRWLWCNYGGVKLSRQLDEKATSCTLTFKKQKRDGVPTLTVLADCK